MSISWVDLGVIPSDNEQGTRRRNVRFMEPFGDRIAIGFDDPGLTDESGTNLSFVRPDGQFSSVFLAKVAGLVGARVIGGRLLVFPDRRCNRDAPDVVIITNEGDTEPIRIGPVEPCQIHDAAEINGRLILSGSRRDREPFQTACLWRQDGPNRWSAFAGESGYSPRYSTFGLVEVAGSLFACEGSGRITSSTDGVNWRAHRTLNKIGDWFKPLPVYGGFLIRQWPGPNARLDHVVVDNGRQNHDGAFVTDHSLGDDGNVYALSGSRIYRIASDGTEWEIVATDPPKNASALAVMGGSVFVGTDDSHVWRLTPDAE